MEKYIHAYKYSRQSVKPMEEQDLGCHTSWNIPCILDMVVRQLPWNKYKGQELGWEFNLHVLELMNRTMMMKLEAEKRP